MVVASQETAGRKTRAGLTDPPNFGRNLSSFSGQDELVQLWFRAALASDRHYRRYRQNGLSGSFPPDAHRVADKPPHFNLFFLSLAPSVLGDLGSGNVSRYSVINILVLRAYLTNATRASSATTSPFIPVPTFEWPRRRGYHVGTRAKRRIGNVHPLRM